jgi:uroporphyrinogen decarboxylase
MMSSIERVESAIQLGKSDRVPVFTFPFSISHRVYGCSLGEWIQNGELAGKSAIQYQKLIGDDIVMGGLDSSTEAHGFGQEIVFPKHANSHPNFEDLLVKSPDDYFRLERYDPTKATRTQELIKEVDILANEIGTKVPVWACLVGPLETLSNMRPMEDMFKDCMKYKEAVIHAMGVITEVEQDLVRALVKAGATAIYNCVSFGSQAMMSEKLWLDTEGTVMACWADTVKECGAKLAFHNCGDGPYVQSQIQTCHPHVYHIAHLPPDCKDWEEVKEKYGGEVCIQGHVDQNYYGVMVGPEEMREACKRNIQELGKGGGYILGSGCEFPSNASLLNAKAMVEAAELYGRYGTQGVFS